MSTQSSPSPIPAPAASVATQCRQLTVDSVRAAAFWTTVFLPLAYVPAAYTMDGSATLLALLALHMACIVIGHEHNLPADHE